MHRDTGPQWRQLLDDLADQCIQIDPLKIQGRGTLLEARVGKHFVHQLIEVLDVVVHALTVLVQRLRRRGRADHLQAKAQARHWRA